AGRTHREVAALFLKAMKRGDELWRLRCGLGKDAEDQELLIFTTRSIKKKHLPFQWRCADHQRSPIQSICIGIRKKSGVAGRPRNVAPILAAFTLAGNMTISRAIRA